MKKIASILLVTFVFTSLSLINLSYAQEKLTPEEIEKADFKNTHPVGIYQIYNKYADKWIVVCGPFVSPYGGLDVWMYGPNGVINQCKSIGCKTTGGREDYNYQWMWCD